jgi:hypothetical protein
MHSSLIHVMHIYSSCIKQSKSTPLPEPCRQQSTTWKQPSLISFTMRHKVSIRHYSFFFDTHIYLYHIPTFRLIDTNHPSQLDKYRVYALCIEGKRKIETNKRERKTWHWTTTCLSNSKFGFASLTVTAIATNQQTKQPKERTTLPFLCFMMHFSASCLLCYLLWCNFCWFACYSYK